MCTFNFTLVCIVILLEMATVKISFRFFSGSVEFQEHLF